MTDPHPDDSVDRLPRSQGGALDPDRVAETFWARHTAPVAEWTAEVHLEQTDDDTTSRRDPAEPR